MRVGTAAGFGFQLPELFPDGIAIVGGIGYRAAYCLRGKMLLLHIRPSDIATLIEGQDQIKKLSAAAQDAEVFGRQPSSAASQAPSGVGVLLFSASFQRSAEEAGWAFTLLESRGIFSRSESDKAILTQLPLAHHWSSRFQSEVGFPYRSSKSTEGPPSFSGRQSLILPTGPLSVRDSDDS